MTSPTKNRSETENRRSASTSVLALVQGVQAKIVLAAAVALHPRAYLKSAAGGDARNILVVRLDEIGDFVMFTPALRALRRRYPEAHITLVLKPYVAKLAEPCPWADEILPYDANAKRSLRPLILPWRSLKFAVTRLRRQYDLAIQPRWDADNCYAGFVTAFSGARRRIAHTEHVTAHKRMVNHGWDSLYSEIVDDRRVRHDIDHNMNVLSPLGIDGEIDRAPELWLTPEDRSFAQDMLDRHEVTPRDLLIGIGPSGGHSLLKQWPVEKFAQLGRRLRESHNARIVVLGGPGEEQLGEELARRIGNAAIDLVGKTTLRQLAAVVQRCAVYVGNDSGPTHIASAMGTPVVAVFGSSCTHRFTPGGNSIVLLHDMPCNACHQGHKDDRCLQCIYDEPVCLHRVGVDDVMNAVSTQLRQPVQKLTMIAPDGEFAR